MRTCEEYVLNQLKVTKELLKTAEKRIQELENLKETQKNEIEDIQCIYLSDKPNYFYNVNFENVYKWNEVLKKNNKTPQFVEEALEDEKKFKELCELYDNTSYRWPIGKVTQDIYNYLLKTRNGDCAIVLSGDDIGSYQLDKEGYSYFSTEKQAVEYRDKTVKKNIEHYLKFYKEKFEEEN